MALLRLTFACYGTWYTSMDTMSYMHAIVFACIILRYRASCPQASSESLNTIGVSRGPNGPILDLAGPTESFGKLDGYQIPRRRLLLVESRCKISSFSDSTELAWVILVTCLFKASSFPNTKAETDEYSW